MPDSAYHHHDGSAGQEYARLMPGDLARLTDAARLVAGDAAGVVAPQRKIDGAWIWQAVEPAQLQLEIWSTMINTDLSPKSYLLPQTEEIFTWQTVDGQPVLAAPAEGASPAPLVLFGMRPCDAAGLSVLDQAMLDGDWPDAGYCARRAAAVVITWACARTGPACLCDSCGLDPAHEAGDLMVLPGPPAEPLLLRGLTEKGRKVIARLGDGPCDSLGAAYAARRARLGGRRTAIGQRVDLAAVATAAAADSLALFNSRAWPAIAERCLSCGTCAYVCPTCHCFAITDEPDYTAGRRVRTWDSCQFREFMVAAGGHNPRPTKTERTRQRFMHKLGYHSERHATLMCVGCGRCVQFCPVGLHIAEAGAALLEQQSRREVE